MKKLTTVILLIVFTFIFACCNISNVGRMNENTVFNNTVNWQPNTNISIANNGNN